MWNFWPTALQLTYEQSLSNSIFSLILTSYGIIMLSNTKYHFSTIPGDHFTQQNHQQKSTHM